MYFVQVTVNRIPPRVCAPLRAQSGPHMLLPIMGLFLVFLPVGGFVLGFILLFFRPVRSLAPFIFIGPFLSSYAAVAGFWGSGIGLEYLGFGGWTLVLG